MIAGPLLVSVTDKSRHPGISAIQRHQPERVGRCTLIEGRLDYQTGFLKLTPAQSTGARFVAQSNVKRLTSQMMTRTGIGANSTSVRLRKGIAGNAVSRQSVRNHKRPRHTIVA